MGLIQRDDAMGQDYGFPVSSARITIHPIAPGTIINALLPGVRVSGAVLREWLPNGQAVLLIGREWHAANLDALTPVTDKEFVEKHGATQLPAIQRLRELFGLPIDMP